MKKIIFALFITAFIGVVIYIIWVGGADARQTASYQAMQEKLEEAPEIRANAFYFSALTKREQYIYDCIYNAVDDMNTHTEQMALVATEAELENAVRALLYDHPGYFYIDGDAFTLEPYEYPEKVKSDETQAVTQTVTEPVIINGKYTQLRIPYTDTEENIETLSARFKAALAKTDVILADVHDDYLCTQLIHDYITGICTKSTSDTEITAYTSTAYGALVEGCADSMGYALAFQLLFKDNVGLSRIFTGMSMSGGEVWNTVLINDKYYNVDVYSDDLDSILNGETLRGIQSRLYLYTSDEYFYREHTPTQYAVFSQYAPDCTDKTNYYSYNGLVANSDIELAALVKRQVALCNENHTVFFEVWYEKEGAEELIKSTVNELITLIYPQYGSCDVYRLSQNQAVFIVRLNAPTEDAGTQ